MIAHLFKNSTAFYGIGSFIPILTIPGLIPNIYCVQRGRGGSCEKLKMFGNSVFGDQFFFTESLSPVCRNQLEEQTA